MTPFVFAVTLAVGLLIFMEWRLYRWRLRTEKLRHRAEQTRVETAREQFEAAQAQRRASEKLEEDALVRAAVRARR